MIIMSRYSFKELDKSSLETTDRKVKLFSMYKTFQKISHITVIRSDMNANKVANKTIL